MLIFALRAAVSEIEPNLQNFHIWACNLKFEERSQSCICTLFLPQGVKNKLIFALRAMVMLIGMITQIISHSYSARGPLLSSQV